VEQAFVSFSPWEALVSDSQVFVFHEVGTVHGHLLVFQVCVQSDQQDGGNGDEEGEAFPQLGATT
jgi:hypothetical protein